MSLPTFQLTGSGATGLVLPGVAGLHAAPAASLPTTVSLGYRQPKSRPVALRLSDYVSAAYPVKESVDWYTKAAASIARMYRNDVQGCCVVTGKAHALGIWSANDFDSNNGKTVLALDAEIDQQYRSVCGPGDTGCYITDVLDYMRTTGFLANGTRYKIDGYVSADWRNRDLVKVGIDLFGCGCIGFNFPNGWFNSAVWKRSTAGNSFAGGHDVTPAGYGPPRITGYTDDGVVVSSWGRLYLFEWMAFCSDTYLTELYFMVPSFLWTGVDRRTPGGVDLDTLRADLVAVGGGNLPPLPPPPPVPPPPVPPTPPSPPNPPVPPAPTPTTITVQGRTSDRTVKVSDRKITVPWSLRSQTIVVPGETIVIPGETVTSTGTLPN